MKKSIKFTDKEITALLIAIETHFDITGGDDLFADIENSLEKAQKKLYQMKELRRKQLSDLGGLKHVENK